MNSVSIDAPMWEDYSLVDIITTSYRMGIAWYTKGSAGKPFTKSQALDYCLAQRDLDKLVILEDNARQVIAQLEAERAGRA